MTLETKYFITRTHRQQLVARVIVCILVLYVGFASLGGYYAREETIFNSVADTQPSTTSLWSPRYAAYFAANHMVPCEFNATLAEYTPISLSADIAYSVARSDSALRISTDTQTAYFDTPTNDWTQGHYTMFTIRAVASAALIVYVLACLNMLYNNTTCLHSHDLEDIDEINKTPIFAKHATETLDPDSVIGLSGPLLFEIRVAMLLCVGTLLGGLFIYRRFDVDSIPTHEAGLNGVVLVLVFTLAPTIVVYLLMQLANYEMYDLQSTPRKQKLNTNDSPHAIFDLKYFNGCSATLVAIKLRNVAEKHRFGMLVWFITPILVATLLRITGQTEVWHCPAARFVEATCTDTQFITTQQIAVCRTTTLATEVFYQPLPAWHVLQWAAEPDTLYGCSLCEGAAPTSMFVPKYYTGTERTIIVAILFGIPFIFFACYAGAYCTRRLDINNGASNNKYIIYNYKDTPQNIRLRHTMLLCICYGLAASLVAALLVSPSPYMLHGTESLLSGLLIGGVLLFCAWWMRDTISHNYVKIDNKTRSGKSLRCLDIANHVVPLYDPFSILLVHVVPYTS